MSPSKILDQVFESSDRVFVQVFRPSRKYHNLCDRYREIWCRDLCDSDFDCAAAKCQCQIFFFNEILTDIGIKNWLNNHCKISDPCISDKDLEHT